MSDFNEMPKVDAGPFLRLPPDRRHSDFARQRSMLLTEGIFADPAPKRGWLPGTQALTDDHVELIDNLRLEGKRLTHENLALEHRLAEAEQNIRVRKMDVNHHKEQIRLLTSRLERAGAELAEAQFFMREVDALFSGHKTQRMSRALSIPYAEIEQARLVANRGTPQVEAPEFAFRDPFADPSPRAG